MGTKSGPKFQGLYALKVEEIQGKIDVRRKSSVTIRITETLFCKSDCQ